MKCASYIIFLFLFLQSICISAQNRTATTRRANLQPNDTLTQKQVRVFSKMLENMAFVDGGVFKMGIDDGGRYIQDNAPSHQVSIEPFFISKYEVTQDEWETVMGTNPSFFKGSDLPVENVSWNDCQDFVSKLNNVTGMNFRLPSEAEWEYAAQGGKYSLENKYAGSDFPKAVAWFAGNSKSKTHPVGKKRPNELGIFDMSGNVAEWCEDYYDFSYYSISPEKNPHGPVQGNNKVVRGGGWLMDETYVDIKVRGVFPQSASNHNIGLRLAM